MHAPPPLRDTGFHVASLMAFHAPAAVLLAVRGRHGAGERPDYWANRPPCLLKARRWLREPWLHRYRAHVGGSGRGGLV